MVLVKHIFLIAVQLIIRGYAYIIWKPDLKEQSTIFCKDACLVENMNQVNFCFLLSLFYIEIYLKRFLLSVMHSNVLI